MIDELEALYSDFTMKICQLEGVDEAELEKMLDLLEEIQQEYAFFGYYSQEIGRNFNGFLRHCVGLCPLLQNRS